MYWMGQRHGPLHSLAKLVTPSKLGQHHYLRAVTEINYGRPLLRSLRLDWPPKAGLAIYPQLLVCGSHFGGTGVVWELPRVTIGTTTMGITASTPKVIAVPFPMCVVVCTAPGGPPTSVLCTASVRTSRVACAGASGAELSPLRTLLICPGLTTTQTPARLHTRTKPSKTITFMVLFS